jgi:hypothetical protein
MSPREALDLNLDLAETIRLTDAADPFNDRCRAKCGALAEEDSDLCAQCKVEYETDLAVMEDEARRCQDGTAEEEPGSRCNSACGHCGACS